MSPTGLLSILKAQDCGASLLCQARTDSFGIPQSCNHHAWRAVITRTIEFKSLAIMLRPSQIEASNKRGAQTNFTLRRDFGVRKMAGDGRAARAGPRMDCTGGPQGATA